MRPRNLMVIELLGLDLISQGGDETFQGARMLEHFFDPEHVDDVVP